MQIEIQNCTKQIGKAAILSDISLHMESGRIYGFAGANGSGKTMLMRAVCGLIRLSGGQILVDGKALGKELSFPESVGALIENPGFIPYYSGYKNLKILADLKGRIGQEEIDAILRRLGLYDVKDDKVKTYSLGMKQKLGIAAAVMEEPALLVLDEPFNGLDEKSVELVKEIVGEKKAQGALVILSCHDRALLEDLSDEIFMIENGRIVG
ncbi:MAG TPA: ATP-binding cassette domain-containing protein [Firmicutes bacterium]|nr:ATP-binding cassette domain-containing protein [Bacillota bacterium]